MLSFVHSPDFLPDMLAVLKKKKKNENLLFWPQQKIPVVGPLMLGEVQVLDFVVFSQVVGLSLVIDAFFKNDFTKENNRF